jgi:hypothetical protein
LVSRNEKKSKRKDKTMLLSKRVSIVAASLLLCANLSAHKSEAPNKNNNASAKQSEEVSGMGGMNCMGHQSDKEATDKKEPKSGQGGGHSH